MYVCYVQLNIRIGGGGNIATPTVNFGGDASPPSPMVDAYATTQCNRIETKF